MPISVSFVSADLAACIFGLCCGNLFLRADSLIEADFLARFFKRRKEKSGHAGLNSVDNVHYDYDVEGYCDGGVEEV